MHKVWFEYFLTIILYRYNIQILFCVFILYQQYVMGWYKNIRERKSADDWSLLCLKCLLVSTLLNLCSSIGMWGHCITNMWHSAGMYIDRVQLCKASMTVVDQKLLKCQWHWPTDKDKICPQYDNLDCFYVIFTMSCSVCYMCYMWLDSLVVGARH